MIEGRKCDGGLVVCVLLNIPYVGQSASFIDGLGLTAGFYGHGIKAHLHLFTSGRKGWEDGR